MVQRDYKHAPGGAAQFYDYEQTVKARVETEQNSHRLPFFFVRLELCLYLVDFCDLSYRLSF